MIYPSLIQHASHLSPWELFQQIYPLSRECFFLDSHDYVPPQQRYSYIGFHPFLRLTLNSRNLKVSGEKPRTYPAKRWQEIFRRLIKKYKVPVSNKYPFFTGGILGYWSYELAEYFEKIKFRKKKHFNIPLLQLGFYRDLIIYDHDAKHYWLATHVYGEHELPAAQIRESAQAVHEKLKSYFKISPDAKTLKPSSECLLKNFRPVLKRHVFESMVQKAKKYIVAGDIYQANLSQRFNFDFHGESLELYGRLRKINPSPYAAFLKFGNLEIISSSPERLIRKEGNLCETLPIAGTRPRFAPNKNMDMLIRELRDSEKEKAEHLMLVDLERNDLGRVCAWPTVKVVEMMTIEKYSHVLHLVSRITGRIKKDKDVLDLIRTMFPGGTITGCPKVRCMEIIDELEPIKRDIYTGSIGWIGFNGNMDMNIVIRTLVLNRRKGYFQVGAGIVYDSKPDKEYEETLHKGEALLEALVQKPAATLHV